MADHAKFIGHLLDPSERKLVEQAREFGHDFDQLLYQAVDLESMRPQSETVPILSQFLDQNRVSVASLRDFKKTAHELIEACRIKSNIHPLLADHTFREAERFLEIIDMFEAHLENVNIIEALKEELEESKLVPDGSYRSSLQEADRESRKIMQLIAERNFERFKKDYNIEFDVHGDEIVFVEPEYNLPFPVEWASNFMYIGNFIKHEDGRMEISYFVTNPEADRSELIHLSFGAGLQFEYIFVGDA